MTSLSYPYRHILTLHTAPAVPLNYTSDDTDHLCLNSFGDIHHLQDIVHTTERNKMEPSDLFGFLAISPMFI